MVSLAQLWVPILLSAILVFVASSIIHMLIQWHKGDYKALQNEDEVRAAIRKGNPPPALYILPFCSDMKKMGEPEMQKKYTEGPNAVLTIIKPGLPSMGPMLGKWFVYNLFISLRCGLPGCPRIPTGNRVHAGLQGGRASRPGWGTPARHPPVPSGWGGRGASRSRTWWTG